MLTIPAPVLFRIFRLLTVIVSYSKKESLKILSLDLNLHVLGKLTFQCLVVYFFRPIHHLKFRAPQFDLLALYTSPSELQLSVRNRRMFIDSFTWWRPTSQITLVNQTFSCSVTFLVVAASSVSKRLLRFCSSECSSVILRTFACNSWTNKETFFAYKTGCTSSSRNVRW